RVVGTRVDRTRDGTHGRGRRVRPGRAHWVDAVLDVGTRVRTRGTVAGGCSTRACLRPRALAYGGVDGVVDRLRRRRGGAGRGRRGAPRVAAHAHRHGA